MTDTIISLEIKRITSLPTGFELFLNDASREGFNNMAPLQREWNHSINIFDRPGEILALATINGELAGIGGITQDFADSTRLRMRRFYVRPAYRRRGVGRAIVHFVLDHALPFNRQISLYTDGREARTFCRRSALWKQFARAPLISSQKFLEGSLPSDITMASCNAGSLALCRKTPFLRSDPSNARLYLCMPSGNVPRSKGVHFGSC